MKLDERGEQCPGPVADTKKTSEPCNPGETAEMLIDNEIAVRDPSKMTASKGLSAVSEKINDDELPVKIPVSRGVAPTSGVPDDSDEEPAACLPDSHRKGMAVALPSNLMGRDDPKPGKTPVEGFIYVLAQQDALSETILPYNSGAYLSCEGSGNLKGLKSMESQGVEVLICGTCLNFYGLSEELQVGSVTDMYGIMERITAARLLVRS